MRLSTLVRLLCVVVAVVGAGLIVAAFVEYNAYGACVSTAPGEASCGGIPGKTFMLAGAGFLTVGIFGAALLPMAIRSVANSRLRRSGRDGVATVLNVRDTGVTINNNPQIKLTLRVQPVDGSPAYDAETKAVVSRLALPHPGDTYGVRYDPAKPTRVALMPNLPAAAGPQQPAWSPGMRTTVVAPQGMMLSPEVVQEPQPPAQTYSGQFGVIGDPSRPTPGRPGGGLTPEQAAARVSAGAGAGWQQATARVLALHEVPVPPGNPGAMPAGTVDLTLDVAPPSGDGYSTTMRIGFSTPGKRSRVAAIGATLPVLVNPTARDQIVIDSNRLVDSV